MPTPLYDPHSAECAFQLRYSWIAWPSSGTFQHTDAAILEQISPLWEGDGMRVLEYRWTDDALQVLFSATPAVSPVTLAARAKGRLDHFLRTSGQPTRFSRKVSVRTVGDSTRTQIDNYLARQASAEHFVDSRFEVELQKLNFVDESIDLAAPTETRSGRYWYNLHLVLVTSGRQRLGDLTVLARLRDNCLRIATRKTHRLSRVAVMPDHVHLMLRGKLDEAPVDLAFAYQNNLAHMLGLGRLWADSYYVGTFGEYGMGAVRKAVR